MRHLFFVVLAVFVTQTSHAKEVRLSGRVLLNSCGYFSNRSADFKVSYLNEKLPKDATLSVRAGLGGKEALPGGNETTYRAFDWDREREVPMRQVSDSEWEADFSQPLEDRGTAKPYSALNFTYIVRLTDGRQFIDDGSGYHPGFYQGKLEAGECVSDPNRLPALRPIPVVRVERF